MIELYTDRHAGLLCRLHHYRTDLFERRNTLVQLRVGDDHRRTQLLSRIDHSQQTFQIGRIKSTDRTFSFFRDRKDFLQVNKHF